MKSDIIRIDNQGNGFQNVLTATEKVAQYRALDHKEELRLTLCAEEMLSLVRSITGEMEASFWIESEGKQFDLRLTTRTVMDREKRKLLIDSASSRKNEAAKTFLGRLRDAFEEAMAAEAHPGDDIPVEIMGDMANRSIESGEWDQYEQSILRKAADQIRIAIRGGVVEMTVTARFS